jgi:hypothetical protein
MTPRGEWLLTAATLTQPERAPGFGRGTRTPNDRDPVGRRADRVAVVVLWRQRRWSACRRASSSRAVVLFTPRWRSLLRGYLPLGASLEASRQSFGGGAIVPDLRDENSDHE